MAAKHAIPSECLHPDAGKSCQGKVINSHTVSKSSTLRKIARNGHVYHYKPDINALFDNGGKPSCISLGVKQASTFPGFCSKHDKEMFAPVEDAPFESNEKHTFLLGYRALTKEIYAKRSSHALVPQMKELDRGRDPIMQAALQGFVSWYTHGLELGLRDLAHHKGRYDQVFEWGDYSLCRYLVLRFSNVPNVVFSGAVYPEYDLVGNRLQNLSQEASVLDSLAVNSVCTDKGWAVVFHWIGESVVNKKIAQSIIDIPDKCKASAITQFAFETFENLFICPDWWDGLEAGLRKSLEARVLCGAGAAHHSPNCFIPDGNSYFGWCDCSVEHNLDI